ncbi:hypothetical protein D0T11_09715 [Hymenobacter rubripertinctus]|uniref:Uncharacterized protein n=1 Tax=Hymenobacter rubripertinctus TaxID=2029981 RepID=A0A418QZ59_9BACT|nr:hypothetical protein D0T11_09715 [Hymenobacter rubripertinctus]
MSGCWLLVVGCQLSVVSCQLSVKERHSERSRGISRAIALLVLGHFAGATSAREIPRLRLRLRSE